MLEPLDFGYTFSRSSDLVGVYDASPWPYRLGVTDIFAFDTLTPPSSAARERRNLLRVSSGAQVRELTAHVSYQSSRGQNLSSILGGVSHTSLDQNTTWPDIDLTQGNVQSLFKKLATDSKLTASYRHQHDLNGTYVPYYELVDGDSVARESLGMLNRSESDQNELNPLLSWSTTWKKRVSTTLAANYTFGTTVSFRDDSGYERSVTHSNTRGLSFSLSYAFSAPQGLRFPLLGKLKFSSDLSLTWSLNLSQTNRSQELQFGAVPSDTVTPLQRDNTYGTSLAASYRFSRSIEAGLNAGYSQSRGLSVTTTESMDLDLWVLFRF